MLLLSTAHAHGHADPRCHSLEEVFKKIAAHQHLRQMCGPLSTIRIGVLRGIAIDPTAVFDYDPSSGSAGVSVREIIDLCRVHGLNGWAINSEVQTVKKLPLPCILLVNNNRHCVVLESVDQAGATALVWDPSVLKTQQVSLKSLNQVWSQKAIIFGVPPGLDRILDGINLVIAAISLGLFAARFRHRRNQLPPTKSSTD
ncbi:MAG: cysteine peptidase family C39 domain-containing protein [Pirellulaceae bacterium]|nr:cysteine peptidase family C39 domain-containing protein [Pirellulaceae bacterium]